MLSLALSFLRSCLASICLQGRKEMDHLPASFFKVTLLLFFTFHFFESSFSAVSEYDFDNLLGQNCGPEKGRWGEMRVKEESGQDTS